MSISAIIIKKEFFLNLLKPVSHSPYRNNMLRLFRVVLYLFAQPLDMNRQGLKLGITVASPHGVEEVFLLHRLAPVLDEQRQQVEFF